jgi:mannose-6-phosphate isomerase
MDVYSLLFCPILKPKVWGGRRLETLLGKALPPDAKFGESWEVADLETDQSIVSLGPAKGKTLNELVREWGTALTGGAPLCDGRFPLLIKFLDVEQPLSLQVHPDFETAGRIGDLARAKNEAWYVMDAPPDGYLHRGFRAGIARGDVEAALAQGRLEETLMRLPARKGRCFYIPGGTVHGIGPGLMLAEVQTPSDTTFRLFDWNRPDPATGRPRDLHIEAALSCTKFEPVPAEAERAEHVASVWTSVTSLVRTPWFVMERVRMVAGVEQALPRGEMVIWMVLEGRGSIEHPGPVSPLVFGRGDTVVIPAGLREGRVRTHEACLWLEVTVPVASNLAGFDRPERDRPGGAQGTGEKFVSLRLPKAADH